MHVLFRALLVTNPVVSSISLESLRLCIERSKEISAIGNLSETFILALCRSIEINQSKHLKVVKKSFLISLCICLGELCMRIPEVVLFNNKLCENHNNLLKVSLSVLLNIYDINQQQKMNLDDPALLDNEDFESNILIDDISEKNVFSQEEINHTKIAIASGAKTVAKHLIALLGQFPIGIGASRLSSLVDENGNYL